MCINRTIEEEQKILLDIYKEVKKVCDKHNLSLFAIGGTSLGAVRHKGFIPWDDDMDFALPREEFERFIDLANVELPDYLQIKLIEKVQHYIVIDVRYEKKLDKITADIQQGGCEMGNMFIDIQPLDGVPSNSFYRFLYCSKVFYVRACYKLCDSEKLHTAPWRSKIANIIITLMKKLSFLFSDEEKMKEKYVKSMKKYSYESSDYIANFCGKYRYKDIYPKAWWESGIEMQFEDTTVRNMVDYDSYLKQLYGDYMVLPDEDQRFTHSS